MLQPSAGADDVHIPEYPIQPVHLKGEGGNATNNDSSFYYRWDNIVISGETSVADESNAPQFSSTAVPDDGDCIAEDLYCGKLDGMGDYRRDPSGGVRIFRVGCKSRILKGGARIFSGGEPDRADSDGGPGFSAAEHGYSAANHSLHKEERVNLATKWTRWMVMA